MEIIKKLYFYRDVNLLLKVFFIALKVCLISCIKGPHSVIALMPAVDNNLIRAFDRDKIIKYAGLCLFLRRKMGFRDGCLMRSMLFCYILRRLGVEASINFGAKKIGEELSGHCWVEQGGDNNADYQVICKHP